jgi:hypothetical protein
VLVTSRGGYHGFPPEQQPTIGELLWKGAGTLYEVDMGKHWTALELEVPSRAEAFGFRAAIDVEWWVENPVQIVKDGVYDVRRALEPHLRQRLSTITRGFDVEESARAERAVAAALEDQPVGSEYGLVARVFLRLWMDEPTVDHAAAVRRVQREVQLERETQLLRILREQSTTQVIAERVVRYRRILSSGDIDKFALQLAQNPDEVPAVVQMLREERHNNRRAVTDFVTRLLDSGAIDRYEIDDQVREALRWLKEATDTVIAGRGQRGRILVDGASSLPPSELPESDLPEQSQISAGAAPEPPAVAPPPEP